MRIQYLKALLLGSAVTGVRAVQQQGTSYEIIDQQNAAGSTEEIAIVDIVNIAAGNKHEARNLHLQPRGGSSKSSSKSSKSSSKKGCKSLKCSTKDGDDKFKLCEIASEVLGCDYEEFEEYEKAMDWFMITNNHPDKMTEVPLKERFGLAILYYGTGGEKWRYNNNWLGNRNHCEWHGITCSAPAAKLIEKIDLINNNLRGSLPPPAFQFQSLTELYLSENTLIDVPNFKHLEKLFVLDLAVNPLRTVPDFKNLPALKELGLGETSLIDVPDFKNLKALEVLLLSDNTLVRVPNFKNLPKLKKLDLESTYLLDVPAFENLLALTELNISLNYLTSIPQDLCDRKNPLGKVTIRKDNTACTEFPSLGLYQTEKTFT